MDTESTQFPERNFASPKQEGSNDQEDNEDGSSVSLGKSDAIPGIEDSDSRSTEEWKDKLAGKDKEIERLKEESGEKDTEIGRMQEECSKYKEKLKQKDLDFGRLEGTCSQNKLQLDEKDNTIKRLKGTCSQNKLQLDEKDNTIKSLQQELQVLKSSIESFNQEFQRAIDKQKRLKVELKASTTQVERLKDFEAKASALEIVNKRLSEEKRVLENSVEEKKAREKTTKEDAKKKLERMETQWKKELQGKEAELKRIHENYRTEKRELLNNWTSYIDRMQTDLEKKDDALKQLQDSVVYVRKERDDYQVRLSALMSTKLTANNPEITDLSDINRPTKLAEQWSELYDNEYTDLFEALQCDDEKKISLILKLLKRSFEICQEIREQGVDWLGYCSENNTMHNPLPKKEEAGIKEPHPNEDPVDHEDPESASSKGEKNKEGEGQENPDTKSEIDNKADDKQNDQVYGRMPSFSQQQSAVKIDDNQKQTMDRYSQTAFYEMVKLDLPDELKRELMLELSPYRKKKALEFVDILNKKLPERIAKEFDMAWNTGDALDVYLRSCIRLCWLMGIQSPPVYIRFDEHDQATRQAKLDKHFYREYTKAGQFIDYVVWPPLQLHKDGPLLHRGVAQETDSKD